MNGVVRAVAVLALSGNVGCASTVGPADAATACDANVAVDVARAYPGFCDPMGRAICTQWAHTYGGENSVATCYGIGDGCARADRCDSHATNASMCTCGDEPACVGDTFCILGPNGRPVCASVCR